jgi:hypothetical protein
MLNYLRHANTTSAFIMMKDMSLLNLSLKKINLSGACDAESRFNFRTFQQISNSVTQVCGDAHTSF